MVPEPHSTFLHFFMFSPLLYFSSWLEEERKEERAEGWKERGGKREEGDQGKEDKGERKGWGAERHISRILKSPFFRPPFHFHALICLFLSLFHPYRWGDGA